jgi:hypothetical protein
MPKYTGVLSIREQLISPHQKRLRRLFLPCSALTKGCVGCRAVDAPVGGFVSNASNLPNIPDYIARLHSPGTLCWKVTIKLSSEKKSRDELESTYSSRAFNNEYIATDRGQQLRGLKVNSRPRWEKLHLEFDTTASCEGFPRWDDSSTLSSSLAIIRPSVNSATSPHGLWTRSRLKNLLASCDNK